MGVIYKAHDNRLQRDVALKFLPTGMNTDSELRQRFMAEAQAASQLDHPNICVIHDVGETPDGQLYIAMPYYQGETLANRLERGPIPMLEAINIILQAGEGLAAAHIAKIVHRDIKPANIMITLENRVKVLDFGIAKMANSNLTQTGMSIGTLAYMSPEQLRGENTDARSDIWALGVVFFELLTGRKAFPANARADILQAVLHHSNNIINPLQQHLPPILFRVLQQSIANDLKLRFGDMNKFLDALYDVRLGINQHGKKRSTASSEVQLDKSPIKKPSNYHWDEKILLQIADLLLPDLGSIAFTLVQRSSKKAVNLDQLSKILSSLLIDQSAREQFLKKLGSRSLECISTPIPGIVKTDGSLQGVKISMLQMSEIEVAMVPFIGPIALSLVKRELLQATSLQDLHQKLAQHINTVHERQQFLNLLKTQLNQN